MPSEVPAYPPTFEPWPKIPRWSKRTLIITEKIDGTNASILVPETPTLPLVAGSRTRWLTVENDNYGFAAWVAANDTELRKLGPGHHFGEWWGPGIGRGYGHKDKRLSLFNTGRHKNPYEAMLAGHESAVFPRCNVHVVPILAIATNANDALVNETMVTLDKTGSIACPGYMRPEGIVIFDTASRQMYKKTFEKDNGKEQS
jgi:hypothetical protein